MQIALVDLFADWKICPTSVLGHSSGEIAAAYCTGAISQRSACRIAYWRGAVAAKLVTGKSSTGSMMVVGLSESEVATYLTKMQNTQGYGQVCIACVNSPGKVTVSGDNKAVEALKIMLEADKVFVRKLYVDVAYHSPQMDEVAGEYAEMIQNLEQPDQRRITQSHMYSSVTGSIVSPEDLISGEYWVQNLVWKVRFSDALRKRYNDDARRSTNNQKQIQLNGSVFLLEVGPHSALQRPVTETIRALETTQEILYGSAIVKGLSAQRTICELAGRLRCRGYSWI